MFTTSLYDPISFESNSEESLRLIYGFEDYTDPASEFLNLNLEKKSLTALNDIQDYSVAFGQEFNEEQVLEKKGSFNPTTDFSKETALRHTNEESEDRTERSETEKKLVNQVEMNHQKEILLLSHQKLNKDPVEIKSKVNSSKNGIKSRGQKRRKRITMKRNEYKERKDVLLKSLLRKFRKFFQDSFSNYNRIKFLESPKSAAFDNPDIFPTELEAENPLQLNLESLQEFTRSGNCGDEVTDNLAMLIGKIHI